MHFRKNKRLKNTNKQNILQIILDLSMLRLFILKLQKNNNKETHTISFIICAGKKIYRNKIFATVDVRKLFMVNKFFVLYF